MSTATEASTGYALVNKRVFVELSDGRSVSGYLSCFDKQGNLILSNATEGEPGTTGGTRTRQVGTVLVPRKLRVSVHAELEIETAVDLNLAL